MKRIFAFMLCLVLLCSACGITAFANVRGFREELKQTENEFLSSDQLTVLNKLGISQWAKLEDMGEKSYEYVSRWMVADYVCKITKAEVSKPEAFEALFRDLTSEHIYYNKIKGAVEAGYMTGDPNGNFRPDEAITTMETATVLLRVLGYEQYMSVAGVQSALNKTNILDDVPLADKLTFPQFFRMIYNALNSPAVRIDSVSTKNGAGFVINDSYLGFEHLCNVVHEIAVLDGVKHTTLTNGGENMKENTISIDGIEYRTSDDYEDLLGYRVNYFYKKTDSENRELVHLFKNEKNDVLTLGYDVLDSFAEGRYTYIEKDKEKIISLSPKTSIIYNGIACADCDDELMIPDFGYVTFIDNDGKKGYEVVKIESYEFFYISQMNSNEKKIYDMRTADTKVLALEDFDYLEMTNDHKAITFNNLRMNSLLAVKKAAPGSVYNAAYVEMIKVSEKGVKVASIGDDYIKAGDKTLYIWDGAKKTVELGKNYNLFVYEDEVVAAVALEEQGDEYAYLINVANDGDVFNKVTKFALVDMNSNLNTIEGAEKITIDGQLCNDFDAVYKLLSNSALNYSNGYNADYPLSQPVRIRLNGSGQVNRIDTLWMNTAKEEENSLVYVSETKGTSARFDSHSNSFYTLTPGTTNQYKTLVASCNTASTVILNVPLERFEEERYTKATAVADGSTFVVDIVGIDTDSSVADVIFVYNQDRVPKIDNGIRPSVIFDLGEEMNEEGEVKCVVKAYYNNTEKTYTCEKELYNQMSIGDVYTFGTDKNNHILTSYKVYDIDDPLPTQPYVRASTNYALSYGIASYFGTLLHTDGTFVKLCQSYADSPDGFDIKKGVDNFLMRGSTGVVQYTCERGIPKVELTSLSSAVPYSLDPDNASKIMITVYYGLDMVYIIEK